jgi:hypothetical protein
MPRYRHDHDVPWEIEAAALGAMDDSGEEREAADADLVEPTAATEVA